MSMKILSAILADEPLDSLQSLAEWWGAKPPQQPSVEARQQLERAMRDPIASRFIWERLTRDERQVLFAVVGPSVRNWCAVEALAERAKLAPEAAAAALERLVERRLIFTELAETQGMELLGQRVTFYGHTTPRNMQAQIETKRIAYVPTELVTGLYTTGRELFIAHADRSDKTLDELLVPYRQGDLVQIACRFGLSVQAYYSRNEVRAAMAQNLIQAEAVRYALARVEPRARDLYEWLRARNGRASLADARAWLGVSEAALSALIHTLEEYALAFDSFSQGQRILFIPLETLANVRRAEDRPQASVGLREYAAPRAIRPADTLFLWDLAVLVAAAYQQDIELTRSGSLPKRTAQRLMPFLVGERARRREDEALGYVELLKQEASELGLVTAPPSTAKQRAHLAPGAKLDSWARHDQVMQTRRLTRRWPTDRWWNDLPGANYREWHTFYLEMPIARDAVKQLLSRCEPGVWYSVASLLATIQGDDPYTLRPSQRYAGESGFRVAEDLRAQWRYTDGEIIIGMLRSTLCELGLVALGYDREAVPSVGENVNPDAFMLTEFGAEVLTCELSASHQPSARALVVQPNFQVLLMEPHMPALYWLVRFAALERLGRVSRFTLTREALRRGLERGGTIEEVIAFLETHSQKALPQNVLYT
ncbi:MAG: helicase-associated domain-containing protein, partial [Ktedonobacterales bacterium]|nr:helicase-associated domain-containing protein [Ktedonobacterales bacterium]